MRTAKQIAMDIVMGDRKARAELEKMMGCKLEEMTDGQKKLGLSVLSATESYWNK